MSRQSRSRGSHEHGDAGRPHESAAVGRRSAVQSVYGLGGGTPLEEGTRDRLEATAQTDLSDVRVHSGSASAEAADALFAKAFTVGSDIHFGAGRYDAGGDGLLAHEVAHTVQQTGTSGAPQAKPTVEVSQPGDACEREADAFAAAFTWDVPHPVTPASAPSDVIARDPLDGGVPLPAGVPDAESEPAATDVGAAPMCSPEDEAQHQLVCEAALDEAQGSAGVCLDEGPAVEPAGPACNIDLSSRPFNEVLSELMADQGMEAGAITTAWEAVQRSTASAYGELFDRVGGFQRAMDSFLNAVAAAEAAGATSAATSFRSAANTVLGVATVALEQTVRTRIATAATSAIQNAISANIACLPDQIDAALTGALVLPALGPLDLTTGTARDVRLRLTTAFHTYRQTAQAALEGVAATVFRPYITGDARGLHLEMLTDADQTARVAQDNAGAGNATLDAGHLHAESANAVNLQSMAWDLYQYQATSNDGAELVGNIVAGTNMNFDIRMIAVSGSATVNYDSFVGNEVDLADIHAEHDVPPHGHTGDPQSQQSVYAHFMHERYYDATHSGDDMTTIAANFQTLDAQRTMLQTQFNGFPANVQAALQGSPPTPPLTPAEVATAQAYANAVTAFNQAWTNNQNAFDARFNAAHTYAIEHENEFNEERGYAQRPT
ncbi:MAG TPA: DUF4157 domain-containing protein [Kofleriaceae bacterium]|nr:DUF4157 domain-containing protein [Kofleriaceae bacterium]